MSIKELILEYINNHVKDDISTQRIGKLYGLSPTEAYDILYSLKKENKIEFVELKDINNIWEYKKYRWKKLSN